MNIVDVVISKIKAKTDEHLFDINGILDNPTQKDAVDKLTHAIRMYGCNSEILANAERLKKQMETSINENQDNTDNP